MTPHGITMAVRALSSDISFRRNAAADYRRMGEDDMQKAFENRRAGQADKDAIELQKVVNHLMEQMEKMKHEN